MKNQIRKARAGEAKCDRCENAASIFVNDTKFCFVHISIHRDELAAIKALQQGGLI